MTDNRDTALEEQMAALQKQKYEHQMKLRHMVGEMAGWRKSLTPERSDKILTGYAKYLRLITRGLTRGNK